MPGVEGSDCWGYCGCVSGDGVFGCPVWVVVVVEEAEGSEEAAKRSFKSGIRERSFSKTTLAGQDTSGSACGLCGDEQHKSYWARCGAINRGKEVEIFSWPQCIVLRRR